MEMSIQRNHNLKIALLVIAILMIVGFVLYPAFFPRNPNTAVEAPTLNPAGPGSP